MHLLAMLLCVMIAIPGGAARAQSAEADSPVLPRFVGANESSDIGHPWPPRASGYRLVQLDVSPESDSTDARIAALEAERDGISTRGARIGMITGGTLAGLGASVALVCWIVTAQASGNCSGDGSAVGGPSTTGVSVTVMLAGLGLAALSGAVYLGQLSKRNRLDREILDLRRSHETRSLPELSLGVDVGEGRGLRLGWRF